jgi:folate-binding protein YgfZ
MIIAVCQKVAAIVVEGPDARRYLHSQLSNDIESLSENGSRQSLLLEPTGKVVALVRVVRESDETFLVLADPATEGVLDLVEARLRRFLIRTKASIGRRQLDLVRLRSTEGSPMDLDDPRAHRVWWEDGAAVDLLGATIPESLGAVMVVDDSDLEIERVRSMWPANGSEVIAGETVPASLGVVSVAVSFTKGCYPGQELVERMDSRGATAPRTLRSIVANGRSVGDSVVVDGVDVGRITSVAGDRALAFVDRATDDASI